MYFPGQKRRKKLVIQNRKCKGTEAMSSSNNGKRLVWQSARNKYTGRPDSNVTHGVT